MRSSVFNFPEGIRHAPGSCHCTDDFLFPTDHRLRSRSLSYASLLPMLHRSVCRLRRRQEHAAECPHLYLKAARPRTHTLRCDLSASEVFQDAMRRCVHFQKSPYTKFQLPQDPGKYDFHRRAPDYILPPNRDLTDGAESADV
jgi:hypothetical protein